MLTAESPKTLAVGKGTRWKELESMNPPPPREGLPANRGSSVSWSMTEKQGPRFNDIASLKCALLVFTASLASLTVTLCMFQKSQLAEMMLPMRDYLGIFVLVNVFPSLVVCVVLEPQLNASPFVAQLLRRTPFASSLGPSGTAWDQLRLHALPTWLCNCRQGSRTVHLGSASTSPGLQEPLRVMV